MSIWPDWLKAIQLKPRFLFGIWFLGCLFLFMPTKASEIMGVQSIQNNYRALIGLGTLAGFVFWVVQLIPFISNRLQQRKRNKNVLESISSLSFEEKCLLGRCITRNQRTICTNATNHVAKSLCHKGLLKEYTGTASILEWPFTIPKFVWKYLFKNKSEILSKDVKARIERG